METKVQKIGFFSRLRTGLGLAFNKAAGNTVNLPIGVKLFPLPDEGNCKVYQVELLNALPFRGLDIFITFNSGLPAGTNISLYNHTNQVGTTNQMVNLSHLYQNSVAPFYRHIFKGVPTAWDGELRLKICHETFGEDNSPVVESTGLIVVAITIDGEIGPPGTLTPLISRAREAIRLTNGN